MIVMKLDGTSLGAVVAVSAMRKRINKLLAIAGAASAAILNAESKYLLRTSLLPVVVVSAMGKTTNRMLAIAAAAGPVGR